MFEHSTHCLFAALLLAASPCGCSSGPSFEPSGNPGIGLDSGTPEVDIEPNDARAGDRDVVEETTQQQDAALDPVVDVLIEDASEAEADAALDALADAIEEEWGEGCEPVLWYRDQDDDGYGVSLETLEACEQPAGYTAEPGDCRDDDAQVHPGQTGYFGSGYPEPSKPQGVSYDYDCDGEEQAEPSAQAAPQCTGLLICQGSGYEPVNPPRSGPGIDAHCGSDQFATCSSQGLGCKAVIVTSADSYRCR